MKIVIIAIATMLLTVAVQAQNLPAGEKMAQVWCSGCHHVDFTQQKMGSDAVPSFSSIAQMNSTTEMSLAAFLSTSHGRMPNYSLSRTEIRDVSTYILSLRKSP